MNVHTRIRIVALCQLKTTSTKLWLSVLGHGNALLNHIENVSHLIAHSCLYAYFHAANNAISSWTAPQCLVQDSTWYAARACWLSE